MLSMLPPVDPQPLPKQSTAALPTGPITRVPTAMPVHPTHP